MLNLVKWGVDNWGKTYWAAIPEQIIIIYWKWQKHVTQSNTHSEQGFSQNISFLMSLQSEW